VKRLLRDATYTRSGSRKISLLRCAGAVPSSVVKQFDTDSAPPIRSYGSRMMVFLRWLKSRHSSLATVSMKDIDEFLASKRATGWRPSTLASQCQALRTFFRHAESLAKNA
jgi:site-specific recombinase XerD